LPVQPSPQGLQLHPVLLRKLNLGQPASTTSRCKNGLFQPVFSQLGGRNSCPNAHFLLDTTFLGPL
jgi:hypothetical protein